MDLRSARECRVRKVKVITRSALVGNVTHVSSKNLAETHVFLLGFWYHRRNSWLCQSHHVRPCGFAVCPFVVCKVKLIYKVEVGNADWAAFYLRVLIIVYAALKSLHHLVRPRGFEVSPVLSPQDLIRCEIRGGSRKRNSSFLSGIWRHHSNNTSLLRLVRPRGFEIRTVPSSICKVEVTTRPFACTVFFLDFFTFGGVGLAGRSMRDAVGLQWHSACGGIWYCHDQVPVTQKFL